MNEYREPRALRALYYDRWKLATPPWYEPQPDIRCAECQQWTEDCRCDGGPVEPEPYTREDYEADLADMRHSDGDV